MNKEPEHYTIDRLCLFNSKRKLALEFIGFCVQNFLTDTRYRKSNLVFMYEDDFNELIKEKQNANTR